MCVYVRAIAEERVRATKCFEQLAPSPPPPPPVPRSRAAMILSRLVKIRDRSGLSNGPEPAPIDDNEQAYRNEHDAQRNAQLHLLDSLAEDNFQLRGLLGNAQPHQQDRPSALGAHQQPQQPSLLRMCLPRKPLATRLSSTSPGRVLGTCHD